MALLNICILALPTPTSGIPSVGAAVKAAASVPKTTATFVRTTNTVVLKGGKFYQVGRTILANTPHYRLLTAGHGLKIVNSAGAIVQDIASLKKLLEKESKQKVRRQ